MEDFFKYSIGAIAMAVFGILGWAFNLSSRLSVVETLLGARMDETNRRLERIERYVLNGQDDE